MMTDSETKMEEGRRSGPLPSEVMKKPYAGTPEGVLAYYQVGMNAGAGGWPHDAFVLG